MDVDVLISQLALAPEQIKPLVSILTIDEARARPEPDAWSILEVIGHLLDEEKLDFRPRLDITLHRPSEPWAPIDPQGWVTAHHYNAQDLEATLNGWMEERRRSVEWLRGLEAPNWDAEVQAPWGAIRAGDLFASWVAHDNLHLRQLVELQRKVIEARTTPYDVRYAGEW